MLSILPLVAALGDPTPYVAGGASVLLVGALTRAYFRLDRLQREQAAEREWKLSESEAECQWVKQQLDACIYEMHVAKVPVPRIALEERPKSRDDARKRKRRGADDVG